MNSATNNTEIKTNATGTQAAVFQTQDGKIGVACFVNWHFDGNLIFRKVFKTRAGADKFAAAFFAGMRS
jgi:hypothetical protein